MSLKNYYRNLICSHPDIKKRPSSLKQVLQVVEVKKLYSSYVFEPKIIDSKIVDSTPVKPEGYDEDVLVGPAVDAPSKTNTEKEVEPELESTSEKAKHMPKNASRQSAANEPNEGWPSLSSDFYSTKSTENKITSPELLATVFFEKTDSDKCPVETSHLISPMMMMIDDDPYESTLTHSNNPPQNTTDSSVDLLPQNAGPSAARSRVERNETQGIVALDSRLDALDQNSDQRPDELSSTSQNNRSGFRPDLRCSVNTRETSHLISPMVIDDDPYESTLTHSNNPDKCPVETFSPMEDDNDHFESTLTHSNNQPQNTADSSVDLDPQNAGPSCRYDQSSETRSRDSGNAAKSDEHIFRSDSRCSVSSEHSNVSSRSSSSVPIDVS